jgi:hypothetical protein
MTTLTSDYLSFRDEECLQNASNQNSKKSRWSHCGLVCSQAGFSLFLHPLAVCWCCLHAPHPVACYYQHADLFLDFVFGLLRHANTTVSLLPDADINIDNHVGLPSRLNRNTSILSAMLPDADAVLLSAITSASSKLPKLLSYLILRGCSYSHDSGKTQKHDQSLGISAAACCYRRGLALYRPVFVALLL